MRIGGWWALVLLAACSSDDGEDPPVAVGGDAAAAVDGGDDAATDGAAGGDGAADDASRDDQLAAFCERTAQARCEWAFECVGGGQGLGVLGLAGPDVEGCAADQVEACLTDLRGRSARGTLEFFPAGVDMCVNGLRRAPCPKDGDTVRPPLEWVRDWHQFTFERCAATIPGTVRPEQDCETRWDCNSPDLICDGRCRSPSTRDLLVVCDASGEAVGAVNPDEACAGEICVQVGDNEADLTGLCSVDCRTSHGCPSGSGCLQLRAPGEAAPTFFCTKSCEEDRQCDNGFTCEFIDPQDETKGKHCWVEE